MGGIHKTARIKGKTLELAFRELQEDDSYEYGNDIYSGGFNNAVGVKEVSTSEYDKRLRNDDLSKHERCIAKCLSKPVKNTMKVKTKVTNFPAKSTRKWETKYEVEHPVHGNIIISTLKQGDAISKARKLVEKNPHWDLSVHVVKKLTSSSRVADIEYKKSSKEKDGVWEVSGILSY